MTRSTPYVQHAAKHRTHDGILQHDCPRRVQARLRIFSTLSRLFIYSLSLSLSLCVSLYSSGKVGRSAWLLGTKYFAISAT